MSTCQGAPPPHYPCPHGSACDWQPPAEWNPPSKVVKPSKRYTPKGGKR